MLLITIMAGDEHSESGILLQLNFMPKFGLTKIKSKSLFNLLNILLI